MSSTTIPSVAVMNEMFNSRMRAYASELASREVSSRESNTGESSKPDNMAPKRKRDASTSEDEKTTEESGEEEAPGPQDNRKIILKIDFTHNMILSVNPVPNRQPAQPADLEASASHASSVHRPSMPQSQIHRRLRPRRDQDGDRRTSSLRPLRPRPTTTISTSTSTSTSTTTNAATATTTPKHTTRNLRARRPSSKTSSSSFSSPPPFPFLCIENEKKERWDPIPLPSPFLPGDEEGPKAAWARLFPHEKPFGEYGGKPTGWMQRMCWKNGEWRARGPEEPYVERFLGRKREVGTEEMVVEVRWRRG